MQKNTVVFDIDGTLADISHRQKFLECDKPDWKSFNEKMGDDKVNHPVVELYKTLWESNKYNIILVSGRNEKDRKLTETWLIWHNIHFSKIYMRSDNDFRADYIIKEEILKGLQKEGHDILFVVDDRK
jgi:hypothetical protein